MLPYVADWRWGLESKTTPWYPSMRLFRQDASRRWEPVVAQVAAESEMLARTKAQPQGGTEDETRCVSAA